MDGYEATRCIRELPAAPRTRRQCPSSPCRPTPSPKTSAPRWRAGMNAHLSKPIDMRKVVDTLVRLTRKGAMTPGARCASRAGCARKGGIWLAASLPAAGSARFARGDARRTVAMVGTNGPLRRRVRYTVTLRARRRTELTNRRSASMLDIKYVRDNQEAVAEAMKNRHASWDAARFSELDETRRAAIAKEEALQAERNAASKSIGQMMAARPEGRGRGCQGARARHQRRAGRDRQASAKRPTRPCATCCMATPNMPADSTADRRRRGRQPRSAPLGHAARLRRRGLRDSKPHWDLGPGPGHHRLRARR